MKPSTQVTTISVKKTKDWQEALKHSGLGALLASNEERTLATDGKCTLSKEEQHALAKEIFNFVPSEPPVQVGDKRVLSQEDTGRRFEMRKKLLLSLPESSEDRAHLILDRFEFANENHIESARKEMTQEERNMSSHLKKVTGGKLHEGTLDAAQQQKYEALLKESKLGELLSTDALKNHAYDFYAAILRNDKTAKSNAGAALVQGIIAANGDTYTHDSVAGDVPVSMASHVTSTVSVMQSLTESAQKKNEKSFFQV